MRPTKLMEQQELCLKLVLHNNVHIVCVYVLC